MKTSILLLIGLTCSLFAVAQQNPNVQGTITNPEGQPLAGVTIVVKGTPNGATSNDKGQFAILAKTGDTLQLTYLGFNKKEIAVDAAQPLSIVLTPVTARLDEMIVIGYGTQKKEDVTGAVGTIDMSKVSNQPISGANEALAGQIAGVQVNTSNGIPGGGPDVVVRGIGAIGAGSAPLYVVDGFPLPETSSGASQISNPLAYISPNDIASISVLKDASATAIYGSRGANGVVMITTKKGATGEAKVNLSVYRGWQSIPDQQKPPLMNARQFATFMKESILDQNRLTGDNKPIPDIYQDPEKLGKGTDWFNAMTRVAPIQDVHLSITGGNDNFNAYLSGEYFQQQGVVLGTDFNKYALRANVNGRLLNKIHVGANVSFTYTKGNTDLTGGKGRGDAFGYALVASPVAPVYNADGSYNTIIESPGTFKYPNPVMLVNEVTNRSEDYRVLGSAYVQYDILDGLRFKSTFNVDLFANNRYYFYPSNLPTLNTPPPTITNGSYTAGHYLNWLNENSLTYQHTFDGGHAITVLLNLSEQKQDDFSADFKGTEYPDDLIETLNAASLITGGTNTDGWAMASWLGRINYTYQDKYLLTATIRRDGSSRFGNNNRWGTFPSAAIGWVLTKEPWLKPSPAVSHLKLRLSYGVAGNDQIGNFSYVGRIGINNYILGGSNLVHGQTVNSLANINLGWEKTNEFNLGIDYGLLEDRITLNINAYERRTTALLLDLQIPPSSGFSSVTSNVGEVQNRGLEVGIQSTNIQHKNFQWTTNLNIAFNKNKTLSLGSLDTIRSGSVNANAFHSVTVVGQPVGMFYGYQVLGLYQDEADVANSPAFPGAIPGNLKMADNDGDGKIDRSDFAIIGNPYPEFTYGITNTWTYRNLSLRVLMTGSYGAERFKISYVYLHNTDGPFNVLTDVIDRWHSADQPGDGRTPTTAGLSQGRIMYRDPNSGMVFNASYLWVKNIMLSYTLPERFTNKVIRSLQVYGSVQNAWVFTPYPFGNPAVTNYGGLGGGGALVPGIDYSSYPVPRTITVGINMSF